MNDGEAVISDRIFPIGKSATIDIFAGDESAKVENMTLWKLKSIWRP